MRKGAAHRCDIASNDVCIASYPQLLLNHETLTCTYRLNRLIENEVDEEGNALSKEKLKNAMFIFSYELF